MFTAILKAYDEKLEKIGNKKKYKSETKEI